MVDGTDDRERRHDALANAGIGTRVRIIRARLDPEVAGWLAAVGLEKGEELVVLRRAVLGGPLHVRTSSGGEFAVAKEIAARLDVEPIASER